MSVTDLTETTWIINNTDYEHPFVTDAQLFFFSAKMSFTSNGTNYDAISITVYPSDHTSDQIRYASNNTWTDVYKYNSGWANEEFRKITFHSNIITANIGTLEDLITFLEANAVQIIPHDVDVLYRGESVGYLDQSGTVVCSTSGRWLTDDIAVEYIKPSGGGSPTLQSKTVSPSTSQQTVTPDSGYDGLSSVTVNAMPSGSAGTPTATKGTVSNHSVSVTPSVTNTTGYITGGTKNGTAVTVTAEELASGTKNITENGYGIDVVGYLDVDVNIIPTLQTKSVTPTELAQTVTPDSGYDGLSQVNVARIPTNYIVPSGTKSITENGTGIDVTNYAAVNVNVSGGSGGSSNYVHGEFTTQSTAGVQTVTIPYTGSGYPIMTYVVIKGGAYVSGTDWYNSVQRYAVGVWSMSKSIFSSAPTYKTSGNSNYAVVCAIYKNSTTNSTSYTRTSVMNANTFSSSNATNAAATCVRFKGNSKTLTVYVNTSSYGLLPDQDYEYFIVYSS